MLHCGMCSCKGGILQALYSLMNTIWIDLYSMLCCVLCYVCCVTGGSVTVCPRLAFHLAMCAQNLARADVLLRVPMFC